MTTLKFKWGEVINRSRWPDIFVKHIARFCAQKTGVSKKGRYGFTVKRASYRQRWSGRGGITFGRMSLPRRAYGPDFFPYQSGYSTYKWVNKKPLYSMGELFLMVIAHEMTHATDGNPLNFRDGSSNYDMATCENHTHHRAHDIVEMYRKDRVKIMRRIRAEMRKAREKAKVKKRKPTTDEKRAKSLAAQKRWERKLKLAQTKVAKYKRSVSACDRAIAAARSD